MDERLHPSDFVDFYLRQIGVHTPLPSGFLPDDDPADGRREKAVEPVESPSVNGERLAAPEDPATTEALVPGQQAAVVVDDSSLQALRVQLAQCRACRLAESRRNTVFGTGDPQAELVFIGEAPGADEDRLGEPFVGKAGRLLDRMIAAMGLRRADVYIMNTIKCRPPWNRDPSHEEIEACRPWFDAQLRLLRPRHICLLGRVAAHRVLQTDASLAKLRSRPHDYHGIPVTVTYHPAYLLRSPPRKQQAWEDLQRIMRHLGQRD